MYVCLHTCSKMKYTLSLMLPSRAIEIWVLLTFEIIILTLFFSRASLSQKVKIVFFFLQRASLIDFHLKTFTLIIYLRSHIMCYFKLLTVWCLDKIAKKNICIYDNFHQWHAKTFLKESLKSNFSRLNSCSNWSISQYYWKCSFS